MINKHQNRGLRGGQEHGRALVVPDLLLFPFRLLGSLHVAALNRGFYKCCNGWLFLDNYHQKKYNLCWDPSSSYCDMPDNQDDPWLLEIPTLLSLMVFHGPLYYSPRIKKKVVLNHSPCSIHWQTRAADGSRLVADQKHNCLCYFEGRDGLRDLGWFGLQGMNWSERGIVSKYHRGS